MKTKWLDRRIAAPGPYLTLCLSEREYLDAMWHCKIQHPPHWINGTHADATVHHLDNEHGEAVSIVCVRVCNHTGVEVAGLLVHEAVHIWQEYCARIGEHHPGREQEAYAIQAIAQELMAEFARRMT